MEKLVGQVAIVTGGAQGLGAATCHALAQAGTSVVVADISREKAEQVASAIQSAGGTAIALELDVSNPEQVNILIDKVLSYYGKLNILINNAGTDQTLSVEELSVADWNRVIGVNLNGPFLMSKAVFPVLRQQGGGHIINIASTAARRAWANASAYHASKWGLLGLSHALHVEGRPLGIKVTALLAGGMKTPFLLDRFPDIDASTLQDPKNVAETICYILQQPAETVISEIMVIPMKETSWP